MLAGSKIVTNGYMPYNVVQLIKGGKEYFDLLIRLINNATDSIHLQTYIFKDDETGRRVTNALCAAAKKNVVVYLLVDGYASKELPQQFITNLQNAGINFRFFEPFFRSKQFYFGRRMHQKIFVADNKFAMVGGINIANKYNDMPTKPSWLDFALFVEGDVVKQLCVQCWKTWKTFPAKMGITPCEEKKITFNFSQTETSLVRMRRNDWVRRKNEISATYIEMLRTANNHITILCSYFLPGRVIRRLLKNAVKRGVKIKVVAAGASDVKIAKYAERWLYDWLLRNEIELYEYQPTILHAKLALCDGEWLTVGSYNLNNISAYASIELNLDVKNENFVRNTEQVINNIIEQNCLPISWEKHKQTNNIIKQFVRWFSYQFIRIVFYMFTFYFKQRR
ncbi:MAG: phospholipase [Chitinophagaceae bacterium]|nr:phospholipase [Chitinophagaceae bacterium]